MTTQGVDPAPEKPSMDAVVGRRIHHRLWDRRETQTQLGKIVGLSQESISKKLRGERGWSLDEIMAICQHWEITPNDLLDPNARPEGFEPPTFWSVVCPTIKAVAEPAGLADVLPLRTAPTTTAPRTDGHADVIDLHGRRHKLTRPVTEREQSTNYVNPVDCDQA